MEVPFFTSFNYRRLLVTKNFKGESQGYHLLSFREIPKNGQVLE